VALSVDLERKGEREILKIYSIVHAGKRGRKTIRSLSIYRLGGRKKKSAI